MGVWAESIRRFLGRAAVLAALAAGLLAFGCSLLRHQPGSPAGPPPPVANPLFVPRTNPEFLWGQLVDTVDDYFKIQSEQRIRLLGDVVSEGRIETFPEVASSYLEPWRRDSTPGFERLHSTLQSSRRQATVRVTPSADGYLVQVIVVKELEDVSRPQGSNVGGASLRHDGSVVRTSPRVDAEPITLGWIPLGRDFSLEQQILIELKSRLTNVRPPAHRGPLSH